jgi:hypothetical protein
MRRTVWIIGEFGFNIFEGLGLDGIGVYVRRNMRLTDTQDLGNGSRRSKWMDLFTLQGSTVKYEMENDMN